MSKQSHHGMSHTPEYKAWLQMKRRCYRPSAPSYENYGARGIKVCARWQESFDAFLADVGQRPSPLHTLDREDTNGDYEPGNVRWVTRAEQALNRCTARVLTGSADAGMVPDDAGKVRGVKTRSRPNMLTALGIDMDVKEAARIAGVTKETIRQRILSGWPVEKIFSPGQNASNPGITPEP